MKEFLFLQEGVYGMTGHHHHHHVYVFVIVTTFMSLSISLRIIITYDYSHNYIRSLSQAESYSISCVVFGTNTGLDLRDDRTTNKTQN